MATLSLSSYLVLILRLSLLLVGVVLLPDLADARAPLVQAEEDAANNEDGKRGGEPSHDKDKDVHIAQAGGGEDAVHLVLEGNRKEEVVILLNSRVT